MAKKLDKGQLQRLLFDCLTRELEGKRMQVEVESLRHGGQIGVGASSRSQL